MLELSERDARQLLTTYHLTETDLPGVFERLGTVQYDPLNPVGRNPDLVLQARVPGYRVDDWQRYAYEERLAYDTWDKQACLVPTSDWPCRARVRTHHQPWHDRSALETYPEAAKTTLAEIDRRGPLSSLEFEDRSKATGGHSWNGSTIVKRILRALWAEGVLVTHHRSGGRHYYDRAVRVIPAEHFNSPPLLDEEEYYRWIVLRRHQAVGLLRPNAEQAVWSACGDPAVRKRAIEQLVEADELVEVRVGERRALYHGIPSALAGTRVEREPRAMFLGPLDSLLWDRRAIQQIFNFTYTWEVYKPERLRTWGYYVLPVFYGDRFIARFDSRLIANTWTISQWWWEPEVALTDEMIGVLQAAVRDFIQYLGAGKVKLSRRVDKATAQVIRGAVA